MPRVIVCESCGTSRPVPPGPADWPICPCGWDEYRVEWQDVPRDPAHDHDLPDPSLGDPWRFERPRKAMS